MIKKLLAIVAIAGAFAALQAKATVTWVDWSDTHNGTMNFAGSAVSVSLTGNPFDLQNGDYYYNNASTGGTSPGGTYGGLAPTDLLRVSDPSTFTITFSAPVVDPYIALVSIGSGSDPVTYDFSSAPTVISSGANYWGYGGYSLNGNNFTGTEYNGILQFKGTFASLTFTTSPYEYWHGFNVGAVTAVPEASTCLAGILLCVPLLGTFLRRTRK